MSIIKPCSSVGKSPDKSHSTDSTTLSTHCNSSVSNTFTLWHNRLGHPASSVVKTILAKCNVLTNNKEDSHFCAACCLVKIHRFPFPSTPNTYPAPLYLIATDLWGPSPTPGSNGYRYYINFVDEYTKFT